MLTLYWHKRRAPRIGYFLSRDPPAYSGSMRQPPALASITFHNVSKLWSAEFITTGRSPEARKWEPGLTHREFGVIRRGFENRLRERAEELFGDPELCFVDSWGDNYWRFGVRGEDAAYYALRGCEGRVCHEELRRVLPAIARAPKHLESLVRKGVVVCEDDGADRHYRVA